MTSSTRGNRVALITGSGRRRVGYVIAKHLARYGYDIAVHYNSASQSATENVEELCDLGVSAQKFKADVTSEPDVRRLVVEIVEAFGSLDVLVTTSSIWKTIPLRDVTAEDVLASFRVNTLGTFLCCKQAGLQMVSQETGGNIITIGDALIEHPYLDHAAYFTAKGSIPTLTRAFAVELASRNPKVRVNCIEPGPVMLPPDLPDGEQEERIASTLVKEADRPESVAQTVLYMINNPMLTGSCITVDGGRNVGQEHRARHSRKHASK